RVVGAVIAPETQGRWLEYAGGYTDMLAQRGEGFAAKAPPPREAGAKAAEPPEPPRERKAPKRRLSFNETHALAILPKTIADLEKRITGLRAKLEDQSLYAKDPAAFAQAAEALTAAQSELAEAESRWLELEILREEIEQA